MNYCRPFRSVLLLLALPWAAVAQSGPAAEPCQLACTYKLTYRPDSTAPERRTELMSLLVGKTMSKFESQWQQKRDSLSTGLPQTPRTQAGIQAYVDKVASLPRTEFKYTIYKQPASGQISYYDRIGTALYLVKETAQEFQWQLEPGTATVAGYKCQKATTRFGGRTFEAWFTREIPVTDGPYKFCGLPGLIVQVGDTRQQYLFELVRLAPPATPKTVALPTKPAAPATMRDLRQGHQDFDLAVADRQAAQGNTVSPGQVQQVRERVRRHNNPLELK